ncbi:LysM peptidoglycan-binding domain-containing protein [Roseicyclus marinus]|uniref:LysM peptidoglycan-binding domain-containing protein n=1 Tax=Roseicyclus marinus TaxID=2161673 RepID=UPI00240F940B|nr:LysM peptidoglycan-binding domain-containing protein [Roseicyclus marinus]MDG3040036.1 LysM peptidoglycan-binding domain-containing protein [Roseicyclus marinus]
MAEQKNTGQAAGGASGVSTIAGAAALAGVLIAAAVGFAVLRETPEEAAVVDSAPETVTEGAAETAPEIVPEAEETPEAAVAEATPEVALPPEGPRFDLVRVDAEGGAVIAGRSVPGSAVTLTLDDMPIETVTADAGGQFAAILTLPPADVPRILALRAVLQDGTELDGQGTAIIAPFALPAVAAVDVPVTPPEAPGLGETTSAAPVLEEAVPEAAPEVEAAGALAEVAAGAAPAPETVPAPQAPAVILADEGGLRVLQGSGGAPEDPSALRLDAITYDVAGEVTLAGRAPAEGAVRATLDNQPITSGEVGAGGQWSLELPDVDPGTYTLRLEQLGADGQVTGTVETPFLREDPERIAGNPMLVAPGATVITVQQGFTLWGIAEANFGEGIRYVQIFEENRDRIRDPDLIFPGQIFALPDLPRDGQ